MKPTFKEGCPPDDPKHRLTALAHFGYGLAAVIYALLMLCLGYLLGWGIFQLTGTPPHLPAFLIQAVLGVAVLAMGTRLLRPLMRVFVVNPDPWSFGQGIMDALERISRGDFDVIIPTVENDPLAELAASVNRMARELGNLENSRQEFISNVSHELQSPLTSISGFADLLRDPALSQEQRLHYLDIIAAESKRLSKLSDNLLRLSALENAGESFELEALDLEEQLRSTILMFELQWAAKELKVELQLPGEPASGSVSVLANCELLNQVWINLLHNAIKFTPEGGSVTVSLSKVDEQVVVEIADTGIGISEADVLHIFERFYRADRSRDRSLGGNGLGLPLAKRIVNLHNGSIDVYSQADRGTTFTVSLPSN